MLLSYFSFLELKINDINTLKDICSKKKKKSNSHPTRREKPEEAEVAVKLEINVVLKSEVSGSGYDSGDESHCLPSPTSVLQFRSNCNEETEPQKVSEPEKESGAKTQAAEVEDVFEILITV